MRKSGPNALENSPENTSKDLPNATEPADIRPGPDTPKNGLLGLFTYPTFAFYWLGQVFKVLGDRIYTIILPFVVFELGGNAASIGQLFAAYMVPQLVFLLFGGVLLDRISRRVVLLAATLTKVLFLLGLLFLLSNESLNMAYMYLLAAMTGLASALFLPATLSIIPEIVPEGDLTRANALKTIAWQAAGILGAPLGGLLVALVGLALSLAVNSMLFGLGLIFFFLMRVPNLAKATRKTHILGDLRLGYSYIFSVTWLWVTILVFSLVNIFISGTITVILPTLSKIQFSGASSLGMMLSAMAVGALTASVVIGQRGRLMRRGWWAYGGVVGCGLALVALGLVPLLPVAIAVMFMLGVGLTIFAIIWESSLQELVPTEVLGRVTSIDMLGSYALLPVGYLALGYLTTQFGTSNVLLVAGTSTVALALIGLLIPAIRQMD